MKQKFVTALSLVIAFAVVFSVQLASTAQADYKNGKPLTSPVTFFKISGDVTYKFFKFFSNNGQRFVPADDVTVTAKNVVTGDTYVTETNAQGEYSFSIAEKGVYLVTPSEGDTNVFAPAVKAVQVNKTGSKNNVDFTGLMLP